MTLHRNGQYYVCTVYDWSDRRFEFRTQPETSFLTLPMAVSCYYLKGVAPPGIELTEIFKGALPLLSMVLAAMVIVCTMPAATARLPNLIYGAF